MKMLKITPRLTLLFMFFAGALLLSLSIPAYFISRESLRIATVSERLSTAIEKETALKAWFAEGRRGIAELAASRHLREDYEALLRARPNSSDARIAHDYLQLDMSDWGGPGHQFITLSLLEGPTARVVVSTDLVEVGKFKESRAYFVNGRLGPYVQSPYFEFSAGRPVMTAAAPVLAEDGRLLAVLTGELDITAMNEIVQRRSGLRYSDDAFLVNKSALLVTAPRFTTNPTMLQSSFHTPAIDDCLKRKSGMVETDDYRGMPSIIVHRWLPEYEMCLIVKMGQDEAYAPSRELGLTMALTGLLVLLAGSLGAWLMARSITRPILLLERGVARFGAGNLDYRIETGSQDEFGQLARGFNQMAQDIAGKEAMLREASALLERRVEQRTLELRESEERYRILAETSPDMIFVIDRDDRIQYVNSLGAGQFGKPTAQVIGSPIADLFGPAVAAEQSAGLRQVLKTGEPFALQSQLDTVVGPRWLDTQWVALRDASGKIRGALGVARDISEVRQAGLALAQKADELERSNHELERFAYVASHDLQEPLRMVTSYLQLLERRYKDKLDGDALEFIAYAVDGSNRMKALINDLLAYSRIGTRGRNFAPTDCEAVLANVLQNLRVAIAESGAIITHTPLPTLLADPGQLEQLLQNLIGNAIKFHGPRVPEVRLDVQKQGAYWLFSVADNGIGIEQQYFERIFIIFQRLHTREEFSGTGIGLAISKRIVERHGGRIWIESQPGLGTTFYFTIPASGEPQ